MLDQPCEAVADGLCLAAVEAKDERFEVALQVLGAHGAVVRVQEPALGKTEEEVDDRQAQTALPQLVPMLIGS